MKYTISIIGNNNKIERLYYSTEKAAFKKFNIMCAIAQHYASNIAGMLLWQHHKHKTIDNDPHARIIKQYYTK